MHILFYFLRLSVNKFVNNDGFAGSIIFGLRKPSLYSQTPTTITPCVFDNVKYSIYSLFTLQPADDFGTSGVDGTQYFISNNDTNSVWKGTITGEKLEAVVDNAYTNRLLYS